MTWANELNILRRYLRDPSQNIWTNDFLRNLYNQAQNELQQRTWLLEDVTNIQLPPEFAVSYLHDWEWGHKSESNKYRALRNQGSNFSFCFRWEAQEDFGLEADVSDEGIAYSHPWEAFIYTAPGLPPRIGLPANLHAIKGMYYDNEPIKPLSKKIIGYTDASWQQRVGEPLAYFIESETDNQFALYGRPNEITWSDDDGEGMVTDSGSDTNDDETGHITARTGSLLSGETGVAVDIVEDDDNIILHFKVSPTEINGLSDETDFPPYINKYIRYRVLAMAYSANTDGRIESLAQYWNDRAALGLSVVNKLKANRFKDKDYRLATTENPARRTRKHPRLPDGYPAI